MKTDKQSYANFSKLLVFLNVTDHTKLLIKIILLHLCAFALV